LWLSRLLQRLQRLERSYFLLYKEILKYRMQREVQLLNKRHSKDVVFMHWDKMAGDVPLEPAWSPMRACFRGRSTLADES
jgi:hypothetical protein